MPNTSLGLDLLIAQLEKAINLALRHDPATALRLGRLAGSVLAIHCTSPKLDLFFFPDKKHCRISTECAEQPDTELHGSGADLLRLLFGSDQSLANSAVSASGKVGLLNEYQHVFSMLDIDWEGILTEHLGSLAGHQVAELIRLAVTSGTNTAAQFKSAIPEVITEEWRLSPSAMEFGQFSKEVSELRSRVDRLFANTQALTVKIKQKAFSELRSVDKD